MIGQILDGRYRIIDILGAGAFGQTYLAEDTRRPGNPQCVVKQLCPITNGSISLQAAQRLFKREAEILEKLGRHDKIPQLLAFFTEEQRFYLVKEFTPGHPLTQEIVAGGALSEEQVTLMLSEVLEILVFVHGNLVIHRDIKPANLIRRATDNKLVLIDFGSVKEISSMISQGQAPWTIAAGTPAYMPVEQFQGNPQFNSDIYALGTIAVQALTGLPAGDLPKLQDPNTAKIVWRHRVQVSPALGAIIDKMVHHHYGGRYQSAEEVLAHLNKLRTPHAIAPPSTILTMNDLPRLRKSRRGNLGRLILVGMAVLMAIAALIFLWQWPNHSNSQKFYKRGQDRAKVGDRQGALENFNQAIRLNSRDAEAHYKRGNVYYDLGDLQTAIADYTQAIGIDPKYVDAYYNRGLARLDAGEQRAAIEDFNQTIRLNPTEADAYYQRGLAYFNFNDYQTAIDDYSAAIRLDATNAKAYYARGLAKSAADDKQGALEDYTFAIARDPNNAEAYYSRGRSRYFLADYQGARDDYTEAIRIDPKYADAYSNRCNAYLNIGEYRKAVEDCSQALKISPEESTAYSNRCIAYLNLGDRTRAIEDCTAAIGRNPNNGKSYSNRGLARANAGDRAGAIEDYTAAIKLNPSDGVAYTNRASAYFDGGNFPRAIADYAQAIRLNPKFAGAYTGRGLARAQLGDKAGGIEDLQKASTLYLEQGRPNGYKDTQNELNKMR